jgi:putative polyhydroxyalkanoate system protein
LTRKAARQRVERMSRALASKFGAECRWQGEVLAIEHPNVNGTISIEADAIIVEAQLGFLLAMFRDRVDEELVTILDKEFPESRG